MIQLEKFVGDGGVGWLTPTTYIQLAGAGSIITIDIGRKGTIGHP